MKRLLAVLAVAAFGLPLGGCLDFVSDAVENLTGVGTNAVLDEIDQGLANSETANQQAINDWVTEKEAELTGGGTNLPAGSACTDTSQCAAGLSCLSNECQIL